MKKIFILLTTMLTALAANALDFEYGDYRFTTISSTAVECKGFTTSASGSVTTIDVPGMVWNASEQKRYQVQRIAAGAFAHQYQATMAYVRYGVESIGNYAFQDCTNLTVVRMHSSVSNLGTGVFWGNNKMTTLSYAGEKPFSCTASSFDGMSSSTQLELATNRGVNACKANSIISAKFSSIVRYLDAADIAMAGGYYYNVTKAQSLDGSYGEAKLIGFRLNSSNTTGTAKPGYSVMVGGTYNTDYIVTEIADSCALADTQVKILDLSKVTGLKKVGQDAFAKCPNLTTVKMGGAALISIRAFYNCAALTSVDLNGVYKIYNSAFAYTGLTTVEIPSSLTDFWVTAFLDADKLTSYTVNSNNPNYSAYQGVLYNKDRTTLVHCPQRCTMGGGDEVKVPEGVTTIGANAFDRSKVLKSIVLPYGVTEIKGQAFAYMTVLHTIRIPSSVTKVGEYCFYRSTALRTIYMNAATPPTLTSDVFNGVASNLKTVTLYVPEYTLTEVTPAITSVSKYQSATAWKDLNVVGATRDLYDINLNGINYRVLNNTSFSDSQFGSYTGGKLAVVSLPQTSSVTVPSKVTYGGKTYMPSAIFERAAYGYTTPMTVSLPSIQSIYGQAFMLSKVTTVNAPRMTYGGDRIFSDCYSLTAVNMPVVATLSNYSFTNCVLLETISLGNDLQVIPLWCFRGCSKLGNTRLPNNLKKLEEDALPGEDNLVMTELDFPYGVDEINCVIYLPYLRKLHIPSSVTKLNVTGGVMNDNYGYSYRCFIFEKFLTEFNCNIAPTMWTGYFVGMAHNTKNDSGSRPVLTKFLVPTGTRNTYVTTIRRWMLGNYLDEQAVVKTGAYDFKDASTNNCFNIIEKGSASKRGKAVLVYNLDRGFQSSVDLSKTVTDPYDGFKYDGVEMGDSCLANLTSLTTANLGSVTKMRQQAMDGCTGLTTLTLPATLNFMGTKSMAHMTGLTSLEAKMTSLPTLEANVWLGVDQGSVTLKVPSNMYNTYKNADQWKYFYIKVDALKGDVNGDGKVNVSDVSALINMILGVTAMDQTRADVNGDGRVNVSDVTALINIILGIS